MPLPDTRTIRQIVIDRIEEYARGMEFYEVERPAYDYDKMSDHELVRTMELIVWDYKNIQTEYRANNKELNRCRR